jgi:LysM repeat protein
MKQILIKLILTGLFAAFTLALPFHANAQISIQTITQEEVKKLNEEMRLVVDKVNMKMEISAQDSLLMELMELEEEEDMLPADDLYDGIWNNQYVKAYSNVTIPDTFTINIATFTMPVVGRITSPYGPRRRRFHYGTDIKLQTGDTVVAAFEGKVRMKQYERRGYGYYLVLRHPNGLETVYGHLSKFLVEEGETIAAGQAIALGGNTGRSTGAHLHFECRFLGQPINPAEIVDFENSCTFDEKYVFNKTKSGQVSTKYLAGGKGKMIYHRIRSGDTLSTIAKRYHVSVDQLCRLNGIRRTTTLRVGKTLRCS